MAGGERERGPVGDAMLLPAALLLLGGLATMFFRTGPRAAAAPQPEHKA
ncbi:MAG: hypothetical protein Q4F67_17700 [Propionibacteriaceae bacterium]|nr:hypothetical protein [Propionibacteriaceae bacterium]